MYDQSKVRAHTNNTSVLQEAREYIQKTGNLPPGTWGFGGLYRDEFPQFAPLFASGKEIGICDLRRIWGFQDL